MKMNFRAIRILGAFAALLLALIAYAAGAPREQLMPFRAGETLNYRVSWAAFSTAASVQLNVNERRSLFGWQTWHFRAVSRTLSPVSSLFPVDDQFDSYTDADSPDG